MITKHNLSTTELNLTKVVCSARRPSNTSLSAAPRSRALWRFAETVISPL